VRNTSSKLSGKTRVQSFWYGDQLSPYEILCIRSFLAHGHAFDLYSYSSDLSVPKGCNLLDAAQILPEDQIIFYKFDDYKGGIALFANLFRYKLLDQKGGWWVDTDVICLSRELPNAEYSFAYANDELQLINNAILRAPRASYLMQSCLAAAQEIGDNARWGDTGPQLLTEMIHGGNMEIHVKHAREFYPIPWGLALDILDPMKTADLLVKCEEATFFHLWNEILRRNAVDKFAAPPTASLIDYFFKKYDIQGQAE